MHSCAHKRMEAGRGRRNMVAVRLSQFSHVRVSSIIRLIASTNSERTNQQAGALRAVPRRKRTEAGRGQQNTVAVRPS